jgi:hypothetical protein
MSPHNPPSDDNAMDTPLDSALRQLFNNEAEPDDDGFSQRVMAALPARVARRRVRWLEWVTLAQWAAMSLAASGTAALVLMHGGRVDSAHTVAGYSLLGLLVFWSIPSRWSRG